MLYFETLNLQLIVTRKNAACCFSRDFENPVSRLHGLCLHRCYLNEPCAEFRRTNLYVAMLCYLEILVRKLELSLTTRPEVSLHCKDCNILACRLSEKSSRPLGGLTNIFYSEFMRSTSGKSISHAARTLRTELFVLFRVQFRAIGLFKLSQTHLHII